MQVPPCCHPERSEGPALWPCRRAGPSSLALLGFPGVIEAAVVGLEDEDRLVKPKAFLVMSKHADSATEEALRNFLREKLPGCKVPPWFEFVPELPKTPTGKIQRFKLRARR